MAMNGKKNPMSEEEEMVEAGNVYARNKAAKDAEAAKGAKTPMEPVDNSIYGRALTDATNPKESPRDVAYKKALKRPGIKQKMVEDANIKLEESAVIPAIVPNRSLIQQIEDKNQDTQNKIYEIDNPNWFNGRWR